LLNSRSLFRSLKLAVASLAILAMANYPALGQRGGGGGGRHSSPEEAEYQDEVNQGVEAYKANHLDEAIRHFQKAVQLEPVRPLAKRYLGTVMAQKVLPGVVTPANLRIAQESIRIFQDLLQIAPHDVYSIRQIAGIEFEIGKLDDAKTMQKRLLAENPKDVEAAFKIGVIDLLQVRHNALTALKAAGLVDDGKGNAAAPAAVKESIKTQNTPLVEEALLYLNQAVENRPDYVDAMDSLNFAYKKKAELDIANEAARLDDLAKADEWMRKASEAKKAAETQAAKP
jgi:tetratricopeptide (TPR) repeat protein